MIAQYRLLIQILSMRREGKAASDMASELGKNVYYLQRLLAPIPSKMNLELALGIYKHLAILDQKFKKGETSAQAILWIWEEI